MFDAYEDFKKQFSAVGFVVLIAGLICRVLLEFLTVGEELKQTASSLSYCGLLVIATVGVNLILDKIEAILLYKYDKTLKRAMWWILDAVIVLIATLLLAYDFGLIINIKIMTIVIAVVFVVVTGCIGYQINKFIFDFLDKKESEAKEVYLKRKEESVRPEVE